MLNLSKGEDGSEYVTEIYDDVEILTRDEDETRGTYTGNSAAYKYTQTLKKAGDVKELKWTDKEELSEKAMKKANRDLKLFNMSLQDVDKKKSKSDSNLNNIISLLDDDKQTEMVYKKLLAMGIIVRYLNNFGISNGIRITIGSKKENECLINGLRITINKINRLSYLWEK